GTLPVGLTLNASTGVISGTPTASGSATFTVQVRDSAATPATATKQLSITVAVAPPALAISTTSLASATVGSAYSATVQATGGVTSYSWSITVGTLPAGLTLNASSGVISGTPTASGTATFTVQVRDSAATPATATKQLSITVAAAPPALAISTTSLAIATAGSAYSATVQATGGVTPYSWSITVGTLPTGLTLNASTGVISGTPTISGSATFTVQVRDSAATPATDTQQLTLTVSGLTITNLSLANAVVGTAYSATFTAANGTPPYSWTRTSGSLPAGLTLASGGTLSGTPTAAGASTFTVQVTDSTTASKTANFTLTVNAALAITTATLPDASTGSAYQQVLAATGGTTPYTWSVTAGSMPPGLSLSTSGTISGTPTTVGSYSFTVQVADAAAATRTAGLSLTVSAPSAFQYVLGDTLYPYSTQAKPAKGATFTDSTYHVPVTRVSNGSSDGIGDVVVNYSTWNPLSSDGNYLLFNGANIVGFALYDAHTYAYLGAVTAPDYWNSQDPEPRWDSSGSHPSWIYYRKDKQLRYYDVVAKTDNLVHDFTADFPTIGSSYFIYNGQEGSPSRDSRYWVFMIQNGSSPYQAVRVFTWDKQTNTVLGSKDVTGNGPNNVMMSPSGKYVYVAYSWTGHGGEFDGPHTYNVDFTNPRKPFTDIPHANWGWTKQGHEVIVGGNQFAGPEGVDFIGAMRPDTGQTFPIYYNGDLGWNGGGVNIAYTDVQGWTFISEYGGAYPNPSMWDYMQIWAFELDETKTYNTATKPRIWRVAFTQCFGEAYDEQANAAMDYSGTRVWWGSNWHSDGGAMDVYQANLPATWATDLDNLP
ncbi:MAG: Ig domain-containing protein, partial [Acidobacteriia bacterium]|nr:Ig domain-containing protein [Terriglobia bacterium]